ncbi:MAG: hypothetical protein HY751_02570 [Nitrospinae bacterium]|nr:hypothetical protein [Nitrospinota bacterium]
MPYIYSTGGMPETKMQYSYSPFLGIGFLHDWFKDRDNALEYLGGVSPGQSPSAGDIFGGIKKGLGSSSIKEAEAAREKLATLVKRFEVTKRIYSAYNGELRPVDTQDFMGLGNYASFAETLIAAHEITGSLVYLNALLKCVDILCAARERIGDQLKGRVAAVIREERARVLAVCARHGTPL